MEYDISAVLYEYEVRILLGPGIDVRKGMTATFNGLPLDTESVNLKFLSVQSYDNGAVWLRYGIYDIDNVSMTIYQPRRQNISTFEISNEQCKN